MRKRNKYPLSYNSTSMTMIQIHSLKINKIIPDFNWLMGRLRQYLAWQIRNHRSLENLRSSKNLNSSKCEKKIPWWKFKITIILICRHLYSIRIIVKMKMKDLFKVWRIFKEIFPRNTHKMIKSIINNHRNSSKKKKRRHSQKTKSP